jgi:hypothetical protein
MRFTPLACLPLAACAFVWLAGCTPPPSPVSVRAAKEINGPPDLVKGNKWDPRWRAFQLHSFQMNHVWAGAGHDESDGGQYRVKLTVWDYSDDQPVAELYFHEANDNAGNPDPNAPELKRPYHLHFPSSTSGPILQALRNANEPVYLYYYDNQWAVGVGAPEAIGVD